MAKKETSENAAETVVGNYQLVNAAKVERAIYGNMGSHGALVGGVGQDADEKTILAEYDRLGGLILNKDGYKVKTGCFYSFDRRTKGPIAKPNVILVFRDLHGNEVEVPEGESLPVEVRAAQIAAEGAETPKPKKGKKAKADIENEDEQ